jgi:hypothetical protein
MPLVETKPIFEYDNSSASSVRIELIRDRGFRGATKTDLIEFQFPPKITTDSKTGLWNKENITGYEPMAWWSGAESRSIVMVSQWVVYGEKWTTSKISKIARDLKGHLYLPGVAFSDRAPFVKLKMYNIVPESGGLSTWRMMNVSFKYSEEMVGVDDNAWPLHTECTMNLELFTNAGRVKVQDSGLTLSSIGEKKSKLVQKVPGLPDSVAQEWY